MNSCGVWESLGIRLVRDQEIVGSNPTTPTDDRSPAAQMVSELRRERSDGNAARSRAAEKVRWRETIAVGPVLERAGDC